MFQIIPNEQTPKSQAIEDPQKWIEDNKEKLHSFLAFSRSRDKAAGLAANQIAFHGKRITDRFFAARKGGNKDSWILAINPQIKSVSGNAELKEEGCLTWAGKTILAERYPGILVSFWKLDGSFVENEFLNEYEAQVWQHEIGHLDGETEEFKTIQKERSEALPGRNDKCPCNSGKKFKKCCGK